MPLDMLNIMRKTSVPFDDAVSCYDYMASVACGDEHKALPE